MVGTMNKFHAIIAFSIMGVVFVIVMGLFVFGWDMVANVLIGLDENAGQVNLGDAAKETILPIHNNFLASIDTILYMGLLGMIGGMFIVSWMFRGNKPVMIIADVFLLVIAMVVSVYISHVYYLFLNDSPNAIYVDFFQNRLSGVSNFLLNLPMYTLLVGLISMAISYVFASGRAKAGEDASGIGVGGESIIDRELAFDDSNVVEEKSQR